MQPYTRSCIPHIGTSASPRDRFGRHTLSLPGLCAGSVATTVVANSVSKLPGTTSSLPPSPARNVHVLRLPPVERTILCGTTAPPSHAQRPDAEPQQQTGT